MIEGLKPYEKYRAVDLPWLDSLPDKWQVRRGRGVFECVDVRSKTGSEELLSVSAKDGVRPRSEKAVTMFQANSYVGHKLAWPGDLVINSLWAWMKGLGFSKYHGIVSTAYGVYRPRPEHREGWRYFNYLFRSNAYDWELQVRSKGIWISRMQLTDWSFLDMPVVIPPIDEQAAIVKFLDHANWKIDKFIRAKRKLIALLEEQKQAIIHRAVTRGLDLNVPLKPSGIPWLGDIPAHWETITVGAGTSLIQTGPFGSQLHSHEYFRGGIPIINPSHMDGGRIIADPDVAVSETKGKELLRHSLRLGDIVAARRGELGRCALVTDIEVGWLCGTGSLLIRCKPDVFFPGYFQEVLSSQGVAELLKLLSVGATMDNLNAGMVSRLRFSLPPINEQSKILDFISAERDKNRAAISTTEREIALMQEYRTRLTADIVTGKLDVREAAVHLPDLSIETNSSPDPAELEEESELEEIES